MPEILKSRKHVFWEALFVTILIFIIGFVFGVYLEQLRGDKTSVNFYESEAYLIDTLAQTMIFQFSNLSCSDLNRITLDFADKIYYEARTLEKYDESNKITNSVRTLHKKYDLLRTLLWMNAIKSRERCGDVNTVVYLYNYDTQIIEERAKQTAMSRVLEDLKNTEGDNIILIPIAGNQDIATLNYLVKKYEISRFPAVIINEKKVFYDVFTLKDVQDYIHHAKDVLNEEEEIIRLN